MCYEGIYLRFVMAKYFGTKRQRGIIPIFFFYPIFAEFHFFFCPNKREATELIPTSPKKDHGTQSTINKIK